MKKFENTKTLHNSASQMKPDLFFSKGHEEGLFSASETAENLFFSPSDTGKSSPFFSPHPIQTKLTIGQPGDSYEQEADAMADKVVQRMQTPSGLNEDPPQEQIQRKCTACASGENEDAIAPKIQSKSIFESNEDAPEKKVQRKCAVCQTGTIRPKRIQKSGDGELSQTSSDLESRLNATKGTGNRLPEDMRGSMESAFGADFNSVRVHNDSRAVQMNQELGAQAFTHGSDIYFNSGKYDTASKGGQHLLAHELTHVVQQTGSNRIRERSNAVVARKPDAYIPGKWSREYQSLPSDERTRVAEEVSRRFQLKYPQITHRLEWSNPADRPYARIWLQIRDRYMAERSTKSVPPKTSDEPKSEPAQVRDQPAATSGSCDVKSALKYYKETNSGRKIKWTPGLVEELFKVVGTPHKNLYLKAKGSGTIDANFIQLVCKAQEILGFTGDLIDGKIGSKTKKKWENWKTGGEHGINYTRLFKDKKLEIGIAIGYGATSDPSKNVADYKWAELRKILEDKQYNLSLSSDTKTKKTYTGKRKYKVQGDNTAPEIEIDIIIDVILPGNEDPKKQFTGFLTEKEITIYTGHARYGTGPDFDDKKDPAQNFIIGVNSALHEAGRLKKGYDPEMNKVLKGYQNDLEKLSEEGKFDPDLYQIWFFKACTSLNYLDEIRRGLVKDKHGKIKSKDNLRVMGTENPVFPGGVSLIVKGLLEMQTMDEIVAAMNQFEKDKVKARGEKPKRNYYKAD